MAIFPHPQAIELCHCSVHMRKGWPAVQTTSLRKVLKEMVEIEWELQ